jgi:hypothetical protein
LHRAIAPLETSGFGWFEWIDVGTAGVDRRQLDFAIATYHMLA